MDRLTGSTNFQESTAYKKEYYNIDEEEHRSVLNMSSHTSLTGVGVQHASKTKDEQTTTHGNIASYQWCNSTFVSSKHLEKRKQHQYSQALTRKQA